MALRCLTSSVLLLTFLYFIQGLPYGVQAHFLPIYLRSHGIDLTSVGLLRLLQIPWLVKVLWAPFVDSYSTRSRWLLVSIIALAGSCIVSGLYPPDALGPGAVLALFMWNVFASLEDVTVDALAVTLLSSQELGVGNVAQVVGYKLGAAFAGGVLALLAGVAGWFGVCLSLAAVYTEAAMLVYVSPVLRTIDCVNTRRTDVCQSHDGETCSLDESCHQLVCRHSDHRHTSRSTKALNSSQMLRQLFTVPGTCWLVAFLLLYKLGEQGALSMMPLFLLDQHIDGSEVTFWTGIVCQGISIVGSLLGGWMITSFRHIPLNFTIQQMCLLRLLPIGIQLLLIVITGAGMMTSSNLFYPAMFSLLLLTLLSGFVTTATFTLMMEFSRKAPSGVQATHYSMLASCEVVGKLSFTAICGWLADLVGYRILFLVFVILSTAVLPLMSCIPENTELQTEGLSDKNK